MEIIIYKCDKCKKRVVNPIHCDDCGEEATYHKTCLRKIAGNTYCLNDAKDHEEEQLVVSYLQKTCKNLGLSVEIDVSNVFTLKCIILKFPSFETIKLNVKYDNFTQRFVVGSGDDRIHKEIKIHNDHELRNELRDLCISVVLDRNKADQTDLKEINKRLSKREKILAGLMTKKSDRPISSCCDKQRQERKSKPKEGTMFICRTCGMEIRFTGVKWITLTQKIKI